MKNFKKGKSDSKTWGVLGKQETFYAPTHFMGEKVPLNANPLESWDYKKSRYRRVDLVPKNDGQQGGVVPQGTPVTPTPSATSVTPTPTPTPTITPTIPSESYLVYTGSSACVACLSSSSLTLFGPAGQLPVLNLFEFVYVDSALTIPVPNDTYIVQLSDTNRWTRVIGSTGQISQSSPAGCLSCITPTPTNTLTPTPTPTPL